MGRRPLPFAREEKAARAHRLNLYISAHTALDDVFALVSLQPIQESCRRACLSIGA